MKHPKEVSKSLVYLRRGLLVALLGAFCGLLPDVYATTLIPVPDSEYIGLPAPEGETASERLENFLGPLGRAIRIIMGAIAVLMIIIAGFGIVLAAENEEKVKEHRKTMTYAVIGLFVLSFAGSLAQVFDFRSGSVIDENGVQILQRGMLFDRATGLMITFFKFLLGSAAAFSVIRSGASLVINSSNEDDISSEKKNLVLAAGGLLMVMVSDLVIRRILFINEYSEVENEVITRLDQNELLNQVVGVTNLLVKFVGPVMVLGFVIGGVIYVTAAGNQERMDLGKKILINSAIGVAVIYGAFALVSTIITGVF